MRIIVTVLLQVLRIIEYAILARCILSFIPSIRSHPLVQALYKLTDPILDPIRRLCERFIPTGGLPIDFSPIIAYLFIMVLRSLLSGFLY